MNGQGHSETAFPGWVLPRGCLGELLRVGAGRQPTHSHDLGPWGLRFGVKFVLDLAGLRDRPKVLDHPSNTLVTLATLWVYCPKLRALASKMGTCSCQGPPVSWSGDVL